MKKIITIALSLLLAVGIGCWGIAAYASNTSSQSTKVIAVVPESSNVHLSFEGEGGAIEVNGVAYRHIEVSETEEPKEDVPMMASIDDEDEEETTTTQQVVYVSVARHTEQTYYLVPDDGNKLVKLVYNGVDVTDQVQNNTYTAPAITEDGLMVVTFAAAEETTDSSTGEVTDSSIVPKSKFTPKTGDSGALPMYAALAGVSAMGLAMICFAFGKKKGY